MKYISLLLLFLSVGASAQKRVSIKNAESRQALPFATAECFEKGWGKHSDSSGVVVIPDSIWQNGKVVFSHVGFKSDTLFHQQNNEVLLNPLPQRLADVIVANCTKFEETTIEVRNRKGNYSFGYSAKANGYMWASYIPNFTGKRGVLKTFAFCASNHDNKGNANAPVRIRFFAYDSSTGLPANEITTEAIDLSPGKFKWVSFDLQQYKISIPPNGVVVAFEMFEAGPQYYYTTVVTMSDKSKRTVERYGYDIVGIVGDNVLGFLRFPGGSWGKIETRSKKGSAPQVRLGISICKK